MFTVILAFLEVKYNHLFPHGLYFATFIIDCILVASLSDIFKWRK